MGRSINTLALAIGSQEFPQQAPRPVTIYPISMKLASASGQIDDPSAIV